MRFFFPDRLAARGLSWVLITLALVGLLASCVEETDQPFSGVIPTAPSVPTAPAIPTAPSIPTAVAIPTAASIPTAPAIPTAPSIPTAVAIPTSPAIPTAPSIPTAPGVSSESGEATVSVEDASVARYIVGEELRRLDLPIKAIGETSEVSGAVVFEEDGDVDSESSLLQVGLSDFRSDEDRRDRWVRSSLFNTSRFPNAELEVTGFDDLPWPLPESGEATFKVNGDLTIQEVTRPVTWDVTAQFDGSSVTGLARTMITFDQFELSKPTFAFILSVDDEIFLEIDIVASVE